jgi:pyruvate formate lyase activating enzyme
MSINCTVCHHRCKLAERQTGLCGARKNENGHSVSVNYAQITALALDPIEKKPLYHFHPGSFILSAGSFGCNMACPFCQNDQIATARLGGIDTREIPPEQLIQTAISLKPRGNIGVAFTYNEPMIGFEYVRDAAKLAKGEGLSTAVVTNGCVSQDTLREVLPYIDAFNIDLKCFTEASYRRLGGDLPMVKTFIETAVPNAHVEITTLVVPGLSDGEDEMREMAAWLASLSADIPYHISRFFPHKHMLETPPTDLEVMQRLQKIAKERLRFVYLGNV